MWSIINQFRGAIQPPCMLCGAHPHHHDNLCGPCLIDIPWTKNACNRCAEYIESNGLDSAQVCVSCIQEPPLYSKTVCAFDYLVPIKGLINQFKHQRNFAAGRLLTSCLSQTVFEIMSQHQTITPDLLIPVPLHRRRLRQRGFNQAQFIATGLSQSLKLRINTRLCQRSAYQAPQQGQSRRQRLNQMTGIFQVSQAGVDQKINNIAIVDDVMTTGATAQALSNSLINAWNGPLNIQVWCVARAQPPDVQLEW
jgi:ComF family protein